VRTKDSAFLNKIYCDIFEIVCIDRKKLYSFKYSPQEEKRAMDAYVCSMLKKLIINVNEGLKEIFYWSICITSKCVKRKEGVL
jgi:hypothetical protein